MSEARRQGAPLSPTVPLDHMLHWSDARLARGLGLWKMRSAGQVLSAPVPELCSAIGKNRALLTRSAGNGMGTCCTHPG